MSDHQPDGRKPAEDLPEAEPVWPARSSLNPGDEAPPGSPDAGENLCRACRGSGRRSDGRGAIERCPTCAGTGRVVEMLPDA